MIRHIVMWTLVPDTEDTDSAENKHKLKEMLLQLKHTIPGILSLDVKLNFLENIQSNYDICLICDFASYADLVKYQEHAEHQKVVHFLKSIRLQRACIDIEV